MMLQKAYSTLTQNYSSATVGEDPQSPAVMSNKPPEMPPPLTGISLRLPLPAEVPRAFAALPEWIIDDMADFILFVMQ